VTVRYRHGTLREPPERVHGGLTHSVSGVRRSVR